MKVMVLDTETTGLLPKNISLTATNLQMFPHIVQISWIVFDTVTKKTSDDDYTIVCPISIPEEASNIHHITDAISANGYLITEVLPEFLRDIKRCDLIVGYNLQYDLSMLEIELNRLRMFEEVDLIFSKKWYDVMLECVDILKIEGKFKRYKFPKLSEAYIHFFGNMFDDAHNSLGDVKATLDVYKKLTGVI
jgi:DNA polymerase-3 subunit alpha